MQGLKRSVTTLRGGSLGYAEIVAVKVLSPHEMFNLVLLLLLLFLLLVFFRSPITLCSLLCCGFSFRFSSNSLVRSHRFINFVLVICIVHSLFVDSGEMRVRDISLLFSPSCEGMSWNESFISFRRPPRKRNNRLHFRRITVKYVNRKNFAIRLAYLMAFNPKQSAVFSY